MDDTTWIVRCARRLRSQWPHVPVGQLEETAVDLATEAELRAQEPEQAAEAWLRRGVLAA